VPDRFGPFSRIPRIARIPCIPVMYPRIPVIYPDNTGINIGLNLTGCGIGVSLGHQGLSFYEGDLISPGPSKGASRPLGGYWLHAVGDTGKSDYPSGQSLPLNGG